MSEEDKAFISGVAIASIVWLIIVIGVGTGVHGNWEQDCIKRGHARYNAKTAQFEWVEPDTTFQRTLDTIEANSVKELEADVDSYMKRICP